MTAPTTTPSILLADPAQVAVVRDLITRARTVGAQHFTYAFDNHLGHPITEQEHVWTVGSDRVSFEDGLLTYRRNGVELLKAHVPNARQVAQLLAAVGVLPERFIGGGAR